VFYAPATVREGVFRMSEPEPSGPLPVVSFLKLPPGEAPRLEGLACKACGKVFLDERKHCAACGARDAMAPKQLGSQGVLHAYTIIQRSFPGVPVPYVSAVVDLEGGATVKGNLIRVTPTPEHVRAGMRVKLVFDLAPAKDKEGRSYMAYFFVPAEGAAGGDHG
jgi:uncharacterized OB-fold protein